MITLRQLRYLSALAKHGHFGRAAEACAVTQPALSMQIRDLERTLGVARGGTAAGRRDADRCRARNRPPRRGRADGLARSGRFCPPSQRAADGAADARRHSVAGALSAAANSAAAAKPVSGIAAGTAGNPDPAIGRGHQERRARCRDAGTAGRRARHRYDRAVRGSVSAGGAGERSAAQATRGLPPTTSIRAG